MKNNTSSLKGVSIFLFIKMEQGWESIYFDSRHVGFEVHICLFFIALSIMTSLTGRLDIGDRVGRG